MSKSGICHALCYILNSEQQKTGHFFYRSINSRLHEEWNLYWYEIKLSTPNGMLPFHLVICYSSIFFAAGKNCTINVTTVKANVYFHILIESLPVLERLFFFWRHKCKHFGPLAGFTERKKTVVNDWSLIKLNQRAFVTWSKRKIVNQKRFRPIHFNGFMWNNSSFALNVLKGTRLSCKSQTLNVFSTGTKFNKFESDFVVDIITKVRNIFVCQQLI